MNRACKPETWAKSFEAVNLDLRKRQSFMEWCQRISSDLEAGDIFIKKVQYVAISGLTIKEIRAVLLVYYHQTTPTNIKKTTAVATLEQAVKQNPSGIYAAPDPSAVATSGSGDSSSEEETSDDEE